MLHIKMEVTLPVTESFLKFCVLPVGYRAEAIDEGEKYAVMSEENNRKVGQVVVDGGKINVGFYDDEEMGLDFARAFGLFDPEHDPLKVLFGFVYQQSGEKYQLDTLPIRIREEALGKAKHYASTGNAFFVTFLLGNWGKDYLIVNQMMRINFTGQLEDDEGPKYLQLGSMENESTM